MQSAEILMNTRIFFVSAALNERGITDGIDASIEHMRRLWMSWSYGLKEFPIQ